MRFFEELPAPETGLSRTEHAALEGIDHGEGNPVRLFQSVLSEEEAAFMGDASFFCLLDDLAKAEVPLIAGMPDSHEPAALADATLRLTTAGEAVLAGEEDHVALSGIDRWWAGTRLLGRDVWRFDRDAGELVAPAGG